MPDEYDLGTKRRRRRRRRGRKRRRREGNPIAGELRRRKQRGLSDSKDKIVKKCRSHVSGN